MNQTEVTEDAATEARGPVKTKAAWRLSSSSNLENLGLRCNVRHGQ